MWASGKKVAVMLIISTRAALVVRFAIEIFVPHAA